MRLLYGEVYPLGTKKKIKTHAKKVYFSVYITMYKIVSMIFVVKYKQSNLQTWYNGHNSYGL